MSTKPDKDSLINNKASLLSKKQKIDFFFCFNHLFANPIGKDTAVLVADQWMVGLQESSVKKLQKRFYQ